MHHGAARIALFAYALGGLLLPLAHRHGAPVGPTAHGSAGHAHSGAGHAHSGAGHAHSGAGHAHSGVGHAHGDAGHCAASSACHAQTSPQGDPPSRPAAGPRVAGLPDAAAHHHCSGLCAFCLAAGQTVTLARPVAVERLPVACRLGEAVRWVPPQTTGLLDADRPRGPPAFLS